MKEIRFDGPGDTLVAGELVIDAGVPTAVPAALAEQLAADPYLNVTVLPATKDGQPAGPPAKTKKEE